MLLVDDLAAGGTKNLRHTPRGLVTLSYQNVLTSKMENSVDPDQLAFQKPADLYLYCFQNKIYLGSAWKGLNSTA